MLPDVVRRATVDRTASPVPQGGRVRLSDARALLAKHWRPFSYRERSTTAETPTRSMARPFRARGRAPRGLSFELRYPAVSAVIQGARIISRNLRTPTSFLFAFRPWCGALRSRKTDAQGDSVRDGAAATSREVVRPSGWTPGHPGPCPGGLRLPSPLCWRQLAPMDLACHRVYFESPLALSSSSASAWAIHFNGVKEMRGWIR